MVEKHTIFSIALLFQACCEDTRTDYKIIGANFESYLWQSDTSGYIIKEEYWNYYDLDSSKLAGISIRLEDEKVGIYDICLNNLLTKAYCTPPPEHYSNHINSILNIKITTLKDFDQTHLKNTDISEYFSTYLPSSSNARYALNNDNSLSMKNIMSIPDFLTTVNTPFSGKHNQTISYTVGFELLLHKLPTNTKEVQFKVEIELSDGLIISETTSNLALN